MDDHIVNPGDLNGRVLAATEVELCWDGNMISALVGLDLVVGVSGFGEAVHDALRNLADHLIEEGVWVDTPADAFLKPDKAQLFGHDTILANSVKLYRFGEGQVCASLSSEVSTHCVVGLGEAVPRRAASSRRRTSPTRHLG